MSKLIIQDKFGTVIETHEINGSIQQWVDDNVPSYNPATPIFTAEINGAIVTDLSRPLSSKDTVVITIEPQDPLTIIAIVVAVAAAAYSYYTISNLPDYQDSSAGDGKSVYSANTRVNAPKPSGVIRELAGKMQVFPDILCPPRRKYIEHEEWLYLMMCVTRGHIDLRESNIYIAETPISDYAGDIFVDIFEPNDDVTSHEAHENWYQSKEVSSLELVTATTPEYGVWTADFSGATMTVYLDGSAADFPFAIGEVFRLEGGSNDGYYTASGISGTYNEIATLDLITLEGGTTARVDAIASYVTYTGIGRTRKRVVRSYVNAGAASLTFATGEALDWNGYGGGVNWEGPFRIAPSSETSRYAEVDVFFPQGLATLDNDNAESDHTVEIAIEWRAIGDQEWTTVAGTSYTAATYDQQAITVEIDFGSQIEPEMRFRRITEEAGGVKTVDIVEIKRVKCKLETPTQYPDVTTVALRIRGTNALARTSENKINIRGATRKLPTLAELEAGSWDLYDSNTKTSTQYNVGAATFESSTQITDIGDYPDYSGNECSIDFSPDGLQMLVYSNEAVKFYTLDVAYRPDQGLTYRGYYDAGTTGSTAPEARFTGNATHVFDLRKSPSPSPFFFVTQTSVTIPSSGEISYSVDSSFSMGAESTDAVSIAVDPSGEWFMIGDGDDQTIYRYSLSTPYDLSTASYDSVTLDVSAELGDNSIDSTLDLRSIEITNYAGGSEPTQIFVMRADGAVFAYTMSTAGDITTATYDSQVFYTSLTGAQSLCVNDLSMQIGLSVSNTGFSATYYLDPLFDNRASRSIARFAGNALYDAMGEDAQTAIDWDALGVLDTLWESRGDYLDAEFVDESTLGEALKLVLACGYAEPTIKEGRFLPVRIAAGSDYEHLYTPDVMMGDGLQADHTHYDNQEPDGVDVEYFSLTTNSMEVIECRASGDLGVRPKRIQAIGITDETKAWRFGMRERNRLRFKPATYTFTTEMDALNSEYGDAIAIASDLFTSQYGEVVSYSAPDVELDFEPAFGVGTHYAAFRNREGQYSGLYTVIAGGSSDTIELTSPTTLDFVPVTDGSMDSTLMTFGSADEWGQRAIVRRISPQGDGQVQVVAEEYVAAVYADDDNSPS